MQRSICYNLVYLGLFFMQGALFSGAFLFVLSAVYSNFCLFTKLIVQNCAKGVYICFNN